MRIHLIDHDLAQPSAFAYANRAMIHRAFDDGELKQVVFDRLGEMFVASNLGDGAADVC
jgi:hypothetical protein